MDAGFYQITSIGFLPERCLATLPPQFSHLQPILDNFSTPDIQFFRSLIWALPKYNAQDYSTKNLSLEEKRFLYSIFTMMSQKYVWGAGDGIPMQVIPAEVGVPILELSKEMGIAPVMTYAGSILYNWGLIDENQPLTLDNLKVNYKLLEGSAYEWFCIVHTAIEAQGGKIMKHILNLEKDMKEGNNAALKETIKEVTQVIKDTGLVLGRMYERCPPQDFWSFRFYFEGTNMVESFPNGLHVEGFEEEKIHYRGASGGQSSLIQIFDAFFSIEHDGHSKQFLDEMRDYMPGVHRAFVEDFRKGNSLKEYIKNSDDEELVTLYKDGLDGFIAYRQFHYKLVHDYVFQIVKGRLAAEERQPVQKQKETGAAEEPKKEQHLYKKNELGTGGTDPRIFLQDVIKDTRSAKVIREKVEVEEIEKKKVVDNNGKELSLRLGFDTKQVQNVLFSLAVAIAGTLLIRLII